MRVVLDTNIIVSALIAPETTALPSPAFFRGPVLQPPSAFQDPNRGLHSHAVASGKIRYDRFLKRVGMATMGDSQAAMGSC